MDNKKNAIESLTALAAVINEKSDAAKLREVFSYVEMALSSGVRREKVLETIQEKLGIKMSLKAFDKNLYRIRKKQKNEKPSELTKTSETINMGSRQLAVIPGITVTPPTSAMQAFAEAKQHDTVPADEGSQDPDDDDWGESCSPRPIKDFFASDEDYKKNCIRWKKEKDEKERSEKEKEMVGFEER